MPVPVAMNSGHPGIGGVGHEASPRAPEGQPRPGRQPPQERGEGTRRHQPDEELQGVGFAAWRGGGVRALEQPAIGLDPERQVLAGGERGDAGVGEHPEPDDLRREVDALDEGRIRAAGAPGPGSVHRHATATSWSTTARAASGSVNQVRRPRRTATRRRTACAPGRWHRWDRRSRTSRTRCSPPGPRTASGPPQVAPDAVHGADLDARLVGVVDAGGADDVGHGRAPSWSAAPAGNAGARLSGAGRPPEIPASPASLRSACAAVGVPTAAGRAAPGPIATVKRAPPSPGDEASIVQPWASTIRRAIARPAPVPPDPWRVVPARRVNGSKMRSRSASGIPGPWSSTSTVAALPSPRTRTVDGAAGRRVVDRVVDQDEQQLDEPVAIRRDPCRAARLHGQADAAPGGQGPGPPHGVGGQRGGIHGAELEREPRPVPRGPAGGGRRRDPRGGPPPRSRRPAAARRRRPPAPRAPALPRSRGSAPPASEARATRRRRTGAGPPRRGGSGPGRDP